MRSCPMHCQLADSFEADHENLRETLQNATGRTVRTYRGWAWGNETETQTLAMFAGADADSLVTMVLH